MFNKSLVQVAFLALAQHSALVKAVIPDGSLSSCQTFAAQFDNTCPAGSTALSSLSSHAGAEVSCTGTMRCPGGSGTQTYDASNPCTWTRKLCVTCYQLDGVTKIKVQSNGLPNHCVNSVVNNALPSELEWEVNWNPDVSNIQNYAASDLDTQAKTDELLCDLQRTASTNMNAASGYQTLTSSRRLQPSGGSRPPPPNGGSGSGGPSGGSGSLDPLGTAAGISLTGAYIFNALDGSNTDAVESEGDTLDVCLSHPTPTSQYHYHFWGNCLKKNKGYWSDTEAPPLCRDTTGCLTDTANFTRTGASTGQEPAYTAAGWDEVIGLAKDGHVIIGPYKPDGTTWGCDRDVCNGTFIDGQYVYVGSDNFPYVVGCWGPGPDHVYEPTCTTNGCGAGDGTSTAVTSSGATDSTVAQNAEASANSTSTNSTNSNQNTDSGAIQAISASLVVMTSATIAILN